MPHTITFRLDDRGSFRCVKAIVGGRGRKLSGRRPLPEYRENWVFEPNVRIMPKDRYLRTGFQPLDD